MEQEQNREMELKELFLQIRDVLGDTGVAAVKRILENTSEIAMAENPKISMLGNKILNDQDFRNEVIYEIINDQTFLYMLDFKDIIQNLNFYELIIFYADKVYSLEEPSLGGRK